MKTYTAIVLTRLYKRVEVEVPDDTDISTVKELLLEKAPAPLWDSDPQTDDIFSEIYDLFEEEKE